MHRWWWAGGDVRLSPVSDHRYLEGTAPGQLADVVAIGDVGEQGRAVDPLSARRGYHQGDGRRMDLYPRAGRHARANPARMGWAAGSAGWNVGGDVRYRSGIRACLLYTSPSPRD